jgi:arylsulfatase A-like enzyme
MHDDHWRVPVTSAGPDEEFPEPTPANDTHSSELFADSAVRFIEDRAGEDQPFFAAVATMAPHDPRECPDEYHAMYDPADIELPENFAPEHPFDNGQLHIRDEELAEFPRDPGEIRQHIADYYAMITHLDAQLGRVFDTLDETGQRENTYVVFTADHGLAVGQHGLMGKQNLYEHSTRVPLVISGPDVPDGERRSPLSVHYDVYPTIADLLGLEPPAAVEGESLLPVVRDESATVREDLFLAYENNAGPWWEDAWLDFEEHRPDAVQRALRGQRFKLVEYDVDGERRSQLFDLEADPGETTDLADDPAYTDELERLRDRLADAQETADDPLGPIV